MATKKTSTKQAPANGNADDQLTKDDLKMFKLLGVGEGNVSLRMLIKGQRRLNGRLLAAHQEVNKVLANLSNRLDQAAPMGPARGGNKRANNDIRDSLAKIADHLKYIGGDEPPGCQLPGGH